MKKKKTVKIVPHPGHFYPVFNAFRSLKGSERPVIQAGGNHTVGHTVELSNSGTDGGCQVLFALLIPLGPYATQTMVGNNPLKQLL